MGPPPNNPSVRLRYWTAKKVARWFLVNRVLLKPLVEAEARRSNTFTGYSDLFKLRANFGAFFPQEAFQGKTCNVSVAAQTLRETLVDRSDPGFRRYYRVEIEEIVERVRVLLGGMDVLPELAGSMFRSVRPCPVELHGTGNPVFVLGKQKPVLLPGQYAAVEALVDAWPDGLCKDAFEKLGRPGARRALTTLRKRDQDWRTVISFPGRDGQGRGYRLTNPRR